MTPQALLQEPHTLDPAASARRVDRRLAYVQCTAEQAECTCPEFCERDHDND